MHQMTPWTVPANTAARCLAETLANGAPPSFNLTQGWLTFGKRCCPRLPLPRFS
jgi:hypothetical protein